MRKRELVAAIAREVGLAPREVTKVVDGVFSRMADALVEEGRIEIASFGIFNVHDLKERKTYVPKLGQTIVIPARRVIKFREVKELRKRLNPSSGGDDN